MYGAGYAATRGTPDPSRDGTGTVDGCYFSYPNVDLGSPSQGFDDAPWLYVGDNHRRGTRNLAQVERRRDPEAMLSHPQSLPAR